jgi:hypothetical protein
VTNTQPETALTTTISVMNNDSIAILKISIEYPF